jgi:hypothetical protein
MILPTRAELGNTEILSQWLKKRFSLNIPLVSTINCAQNQIPKRNENEKFINLCSSILVYTEKKIFFVLCTPHFYSFMF